MAKILKYPGCDREIRTGKTRDLNKHMNLNRNLHKGQCQPALLIMQNVGNVTLEQNTPQTENVTLEQNPPSTPEESEMSQRLEAQYPQYSASSSSKQNSMSYQDKTILIHKNIANGFEFYDRKRKWYGVKEDFCTLHNKYYFIKANNRETIMEAYKRINDESEAIAKKTNSRIDMRKSRNYTLTTIKFFKETTLAPQKSEKINEQEKKWSKFPYRIYKATIKGNPPKKSLQCTRYLRYNPHGIYTHYDLECAQKNRLKGNILYKIKKEGGIEEKVTGKVELKTGIEMGKLKFEKNGVCVVKNCISIIWKPSYPEIPNLIIFKENKLRSTNSLPDFEKI
ncbi:2262_t:CDS:2 [Dentiscutata heterogama]|uniref:2262_t:CDS:1 n=1 Tax=Dentiscutata heterogama TaxID=1316150 RepID=A0ACA9NQ68_9GLOM|nr:2262_t:CDS:2 [Dentiscutata heterogama]